MKFMLVAGIVTFLVMQKMAQVLIYLFCILLFGYGSFVMVRDFRTWLRERRAHRKACAA